MLPGKFFVFDASTVCSNVVPLLTKALCILLLTKRYASRDMDDVTEECIWGIDIYLFPTDFKHQL